MLNRRQLLKGISAAALSAPIVSFGRAQTDARLIVVVLRGAMDGLALLPPYGDGGYRALRGQLALQGPTDSAGVLKLDGLFGLHPACTNLFTLFKSNEALLLHAVASPYRQRSHFDGQDVLENGVASAGGRRDGWLNRAIAPLGGRVGSEVAIALAQNTPLILRGANSVTTWAPSQLPEADDDTLERLAALYAEDEFFSARLARALDSQSMAGDLAQGGNQRRRRNDAALVKAALQQAGRFLTAERGPRIAVIESGGWDTHANQGAENGQLANKFAALDEGLAGLQAELGEHWSQTAVVVVTEFGRTAAINGTRGTDHGTASASILLGGAVNGGRVVADWPGLGPQDLYEQRDLRPTTDLRALFKGILLAHLGLSESVVEESVFPDSANVKALEDLFSA